MSNAFHILNATRKQFGLAAAGRMLLDRIGARLFDRHVMEVVWLDLKNAEPQLPIPGFEFRFLTANEMRHFGEDPSFDLDLSLADEINRGESLCFAALENGQLAAYGWYAIQRAAPQHCFGVGLRLPPNVAYMFKGFTHPTFRGRRLHAAVMGLALEALADRGIRALISTVEWTNEASLRSCDRLKYLRLGRIVQTGKPPHRKVSIPPEIMPLTRVEFVPAAEWLTPEQCIPQPQLTSAR